MNVVVAPWFTVCGVDGAIVPLPPVTLGVTVCVVGPPPITLMHALAVTLWPSGLVIVTVCDPAVVAVMFSVTCVGES